MDEYSLKRRLVFFPWRYWAAADENLSTGYLSSSSQRPALFESSTYKREKKMSTSLIVLLYCEINLPIGTSLV